MSFNSKSDYLDPESAQQMKDAFANNPVRNNVVSDFVNDLNFGELKKKPERKQSVSITMTPSMKNELTKIAKQNGYAGLSAFAVDVFEAIIAKQQ